MIVLGLSIIVINLAARIIAIDHDSDYQLIAVASLVVGILSVISVVLGAV